MKKILQKTILLMLAISALMLAACDPVVKDPDLGNTTTDIASQSLAEKPTGKFIPSAKSYEEYKKALDEKYPVQVKILGCGNDDCLRAKTNDKDMVFGEIVKVTVPKGYMQKGASIVPRLTLEGSDTIVELPDTAFLGFVRVAVPFDGDPQEYWLSSGGKEQGFFSEENTVIFYTNHFSNWEFRQRYEHKQEKQKHVVQLEIDMGDGPQKMSDSAYEVNDGAETLAVGITGSQGEMVMYLSEDKAQKLLAGELTAKALTKNNMVDIRKQDSSNYQAQAVISFGKAIITPVESRDAFRVFLQTHNVKNFWEDKYGSYATFLKNPITIYLPDPDGSYFGQVKSNLDVADFFTYAQIGFDPKDLDDLGMGKGDGDAIAHEYAHYATWYLYGVGGWASLSKSNAQHFPGEIVHSPGDAFKEDIAYFTESVFDGKRHSDLDFADPAKKIAGYHDYWASAKEKYIAAKDKDERDLIRDKAKRFYDANNPFIAGFLEDPGKVDGLGGNVLYDLYEKDGKDEFERIWDILRTKKPTGILEFAEEYRKNYGEQRFFELNKSMVKYGIGADIRELDLFWEGCLYQGDGLCDDNDPCTADYCMEAGQCSDNYCPGGSTSCTESRPCQKPECVHTYPITNAFSNPPDTTRKEMYLPLNSPAECIDNKEFGYGHCTYICCNQGAVHYTVKTKNFVSQESAECFGLGSGNPCISKESTNLCCSDDDCKTGTNKQYYDIFARPSAFNDVKCVNNLCKYVHVLAVGTVVTCTTSKEQNNDGIMIRHAVTTCTYKTD